MTVPNLPDQTIHSLAQEIQNAATHAQLTKLFSDCGIKAPRDPKGLTSIQNVDTHNPNIEAICGPKHFRISEALVRRQASDQCGNNVVAFLQAFFKPMRFVGRQEVFEQFRHAANLLLAFEGLQINESGIVHAVNVATTIREAEECAGRLKAELKRRVVHHDVLTFCRAELLDQNYFHAILEATKSVAQKIRDRTGLTDDGSDLVDKVFTRSKPLLVWNALQTSSELAEHSGTMNLLKGMFSLFRNPTAHDPKIARNYSEDEALELLTLVSLLHRRIDQAQRTSFNP